MYKLSLLVLSGLLLFCSGAIAQSVVITKRTVTYKRTKPVADHKRTFTVHYPVVRGAAPAVARLIRSHLDYFKLWNISLKEEMGEVQWLEEADFDVQLNEKGVLAVRLWIEGSGAYPSGDVKYVVINSKTGRQVKAADILVDRVKLISKLDAMLKKEIAQRKDELKKDPENSELDLDDLFDGKSFAAASLETFIVTRDGVTFHYDFGFPHVIQALAPDGQYELRWSELKPFIRRDGLLASFVR